MSIEVRLAFGGNRTSEIQNFMRFPKRGHVDQRAEEKKSETTFY